jgi:hypothetical protein
MKLDKILVPLELEVVLLRVEASGGAVQGTAR